jgi:hypothetical protein
VVSRPALQRRVIRGCHPGDYAILNSNHTHDGTAQAVAKALAD